MTKEEIENRIIVCEMKANAYREVGNTKTADRYDNEKYKWEKLLSDLELLDERKIKELLDYKKGYFNLEQQNQKYKEVIDKINNYIDNYDIFKVFSFPLMKRWEEEQVKSSIDYEFKTSLIKDLKDIVKEVE